LTIPVCFLIITAEFTKRCKPVYSIIVLNTGAFYSETKYPREDKAGSKLVPLKQGNNMRGANNLKELDTRKYGGYKGGVFLIPLAIYTGISTNSI